jgi:hypothetical protein
MNKSLREIFHLCPVLRSPDCDMRIKGRRRKLQALVI